MERVQLDARDEWIRKYFTICKTGWYHAGAYCSGCQITLQLGRVVMNCYDPGLLVDHINMDAFDNRRENLRVVAKGTNVQNSPPRSTLGKGIKLSRSGKFEARIMKDYVYVHLGTFNTVEEARAAYDKAAIEMFGEGAHTNATTTTGE